MSYDDAIAMAGGIDRKHRQPAFSCCRLSADT